MTSLQNLLRYDPLSILLQADDEAIPYFVNRDFLDDEVPSIEAVWDSALAQRLLRRQQPDGSWPGAKRNKPAYPSNHSELIATFKQFRLLVERYEFDSQHEATAAAAEYLLSFQSPEGDLRGFIANQYAPYYTGYVLSLLMRAGYTADPRVERGMVWLLTMRQDDGGWTIPILTHHFDRPTMYELTSSYQDPVVADRTQPFSHNWTDMVLRAFAAHPDYRWSPEAHAAGVLLKTRFFRPDAYSSYRAPRYWTRFAFWWPNLLTAMESLAALGFAADDPDMSSGLRWFVENQRPDGLWDLTNDGSQLRPTALNVARRAWLGLRICRLLDRLLGGATDRPRRV